MSICSKCFMGVIITLISLQGTRNNIFFILVIDFLLFVSLWLDLVSHSIYLIMWWNIQVDIVAVCAII